MLGNDFSYKLANNVKDLHLIFYNIFLVDSSIIINKSYIIKMSQRRRNPRRTPNIIMNQVAGTRGWNGVTSRVSQRMMFAPLTRVTHGLR